MTDQAPYGISEYATKQLLERRAGETDFALLARAERIAADWRLTRPDVAVILQNKGAYIVASDKIAPHR